MDKAVCNKCAHFRPLYHSNRAFKACHYILDEGRSRVETDGEWLSFEKKRRKRKKSALDI